MFALLICEYRSAQKGENSATTYLWLALIAILRAACLTG
ncbi:hypothetical protein AERO9A_230177 [Aeromonas salmonicida]|nr:hypothetical protein AERO9A_230177 [Aeromonas salmonicida]